MSRERANLQEQNESLTQKVTVAARLEAKEIVVTPLNMKDRPTDRLSKIAKIRVAFTIAKNVSAEVGLRTLYLRLTRPDGQLLFHSKSDTFRFEDTDINFSASRQVEYGGEDTKTFIVYTVDMGDLMAGGYEAEIFAGGERIGKADFNIDK